MLSICSTKSVLFEAFELFPRAQDVLACRDALKCPYPGVAVSIPYQKFRDADFQEEIALLLNLNLHPGKHSEIFLNRALP